jgi:pimeloyl-ACP methyl ester carboxylesterase
MKGPSMALPDLVLVHGGAHAGDCWDLVVAELHCQEPELRTLAVDLPGRGRSPGDLATATIGEWVNSVVDDIERERLGDIVIVGHSMAGVTVPGVVGRIPVNVATSRLFGGCGGSCAEDSTWPDVGGEAGVVRSADHTRGG